MSRAPAHKCHGKIYLYTTNPLNLGVHWNPLVRERPNRKGHLSQHLGDDRVGSAIGRAERRQGIDCH